MYFRQEDKIKEIKEGHKVLYREVKQNTKQTVELTKAVVTTNQALVEVEDRVGLAEATLVDQ
jgi:hypothetical protein